jgi:desulfoferrodoxin-like iron-binding protein
MTADHHIEWIEVWADGMCLQRIEFAQPTWSQPIAAVKLVAQKPTTVTVRILCNLHGFWENTVQLQPSASTRSGY